MRTFFNAAYAFLASADTAVAGYYLYCLKNNPGQEIYYLSEVLFSLILATWMIMSIKNEKHDE